MVLLLCPPLWRISAHSRPRFLLRLPMADCPLPGWRASAILVLDHQGRKELEVTFYQRSATRMRTTMARKRPEQRQQGAALSPDDATVLELVVQNLRLLAELRARYRSASRGGPVGQDVRSPKDAYDLLAPEMEALPQEQLRVVLLNTRNRVLDVVMVYQGSVHNAVVRLAELFREAIVANAPAVILTHNHPSGDPEPSPSDLEMTRQAGQAAQLLGIELLDHVVIGQGSFVSLKERGAM